MHFCVSQDLLTNRCRRGKPPSERRRFDSTMFAQHDLKKRAHAGTGEENKQLQNKRHGGASAPRGYSARTLLARHSSSSRKCVHWLSAQCWRSCCAHSLSHVQATVARYVMRRIQSSRSSDSDVSRKFRTCAQQQKRRSVPR